MVIAILMKITAKLLKKVMNLFFVIKYWRFELRMSSPQYN
jgi:hypothetical protein